MLLGDKIFRVSNNHGNFSYCEVGGTLRMEKSSGYHLNQILTKLITNNRVV